MAQTAYEPRRGILGTAGRWESAGGKTITPPLAKLVSGTKCIVEGQRLTVNPSVDRYKPEIANLSAAL